MADSRKIANSSMIDLKAELFRKQEEYKQLKAQNASDYVKGAKTSKLQGKGDVWSKKNVGVLQRASRDLAQKQEEDDIMEKSRKALEAKSRIYDKIASASGIPDEDGSEGYLVDFQRKAITRIVEQRRGEGKVGEGVSTIKDHGSSDDDTCSNEPIPLPANPGEEWVDYVDTFGRSRRCMKKDLPHMETQERPLGKPPGDGGLKLKEGATLLSADMKRELRRQQWEKEAEEAASGPVHYANVQFDEIRTHGTAFYQFSKDSNLREEQMDMLHKLREETTEAHQRSERIKAKRKAVLEARLAKVKQRRKMKDGSSIGLDDKEEEKKPAENPPVATTQEPEPLTRDDSWRRTAPVREWDIGKEKLPEWNAKRYMEQKRSERESEFAPPQFYFDQKKTGRATLVGPYTPSGDADSHSGAAYGPTPQPSSSSSNIDPILKQIRQSVGTLPQTPDVHQDMKPPGVGERQTHSSTNNLPAVDLDSIPMPPVGPVTDSAQSSGTVKAGERMEVDNTYEDSRAGSSGGRQFSQQTVSAGVGPGYGQTLPSVHSQGYGQQTGFCGPVLDMSVPPPGFPLQPQYPGPQPHVGPPPQPSVLPSSTPPASSFAGEQDPSFRKSFVYPSQQGLLNAQPQPPSSQTAPVVQSSNPKPVATKASVPKIGMVDKRFMQNREVSDEDLLGYMAQESADPLTKVQAVSYTPGIFSSCATDQSNKPAHSESHTDVETSLSAKVKTTGEDRPAAQTEGVIFGVPDFLQPASVTATTYQPGSFMAAKEAAAQRAEEEYEAARKKTQYSSAAILYSRSDDIDPWEQDGTDGSGKRAEKEKNSVKQGNDADDEFAKFMKEVKGGK